MKAALPALATLMLGGDPVSSQDAAAVTVLRPDEQPASRGAETYFTGEVLVASRFQREAPASIGGGIVTFAPGARTAWHTHPLGQTLIVTQGEGLVQHWGGPVETIRLGDVVWIPPGVKHWHGATPASGMTHAALAEALDGRSVDWLEQVSDDQYADGSKDIGDAR